MEFGQVDQQDEESGLYSACSEKGSCLIYTERGEIVGRYVIMCVCVCRWEAKFCLETKEVDTSARTQGGAIFRTKNRGVERLDGGVERLDGNSVIRKEIIVFQWNLGGCWYDQTEVQEACVSVCGLDLF
jgi:hypothetical protein